MLKPTRLLEELDARDAVEAGRALSWERSSDIVEDLRREAE